IGEQSGGTSHQARRKLNHEHERIDRKNQFQGRTLALLQRFNRTRLVFAAVGHSQDFPSGPHWSNTVPNNTLLPPAGRPPIQRRRARDDQRASSLPPTVSASALRVAS